MKKNIILSAILALVMVISILPMSAFAAETAPAYDPSAKTITITNAEDMRWLSTYDGSINGMPATFAGWTINIVNDIDLGNVAWTPIADFRGKMVGVTEVEGGTRTISNLSVNVETEGAGLCAKSGGGARFENLTISNSNIHTTKPYAGAFIGNGFTSTFVNCHTFNTGVYGQRWVGGIVGFNYGSITNCSVKADKETVISAQLNVNNILDPDGGGDNVGGIVGQIGEGSFVISGCTVDGVKVKASRQAGGIAGMAMYQNVVKECKVYNTDISVTATRDLAFGSVGRTAAIGGIVGQIQPSAGTVVTITGNTVGSGTTIARTNGSTRYCGWVLGDATRAKGDTSLYNVSGNICEITTSLNEIGK